MIMKRCIYNKEAKALDDMLKVMIDGYQPHVEELEVDEDSKKRLSLLVQKGFVCQVKDVYYTPQYMITSSGKMFYQSGGFTKEVLYAKLNRLQLWFTIITFIIAVWSFIRTF